MERLLSMSYASRLPIGQICILPPTNFSSSLVLKAPAPFSVQTRNFRMPFRISCLPAASEPDSTPFDIAILEAYTEKVPSELLLVHAMVDDEEDEVLIFKGHSSSLMRATSPDLEDTLLPPTATILGIDRMKGPYNPDKPKFIERGLSWNNFVKLIRSGFS
ncbi:hypothetical protein KP509_37G025000 [Ceratopteris richardii]|uniref:DUF7734 domain-containing protein n=1 Tax=Ceratopteris richardii TaxID=49495 RepID=A0A8T2Q7D4_CERRI|nr:hypothetical protein KP509_37G025000 [Ceratopteris richardii]